MRSSPHPQSRLRTTDLFLPCRSRVSSPCPPHKRRSLGCHGRLGILLKVFGCEARCNASKVPFMYMRGMGNEIVNAKELGELNCTAVQYDAVLCEACHGCRSCVHGHHRGPRNVAAFTSNSAPASLCWRNTYRSSTLCSWIMGASDGAGPVPTTNQVRLVPRATANGAPSGPLAGGATSDEEGQSKRDDNGTY